MKSNSVSIILLSALIALYSCKGNKTQAGQDTTVVSPAAAEQSQPNNNAGAATKTYSVIVTPDSASLGKNMEALVKIKNVKAVQLSSPDQENTGIELSYDIEVTNKNSIGGSSVYINPSNFRLELDNGTKLTEDTYNTVTADAEATATSSGNIFKLPAGAKPVSLNLFYNDTRATLKLELK